MRLNADGVPTTPLPRRPNLDCFGSRDFICSKNIICLASKYATSQASFYCSCFLVLGYPSLSEIKVPIKHQEKKKSCGSAPGVRVAKALRKSSCFLFVSFHLNFYWISGLDMSGLWPHINNLKPRTIWHYNQKISGISITSEPWQRVI